MENMLAGKNLCKDNDMHKKAPYYYVGLCRRKKRPLLSIDGSAGGYGVAGKKGHSTFL